MVWALAELLNKLSTDIVLDKAPISVLDRKLQKAYLHILVDLKNSEDTDVEVKGLVIAQLDALEDRFKKFSKSSNPPAGGPRRIWYGYDEELKLTLMKVSNGKLLCMALGCWALV